MCFSWPHSPILSLTQQRLQVQHHPTMARSMGNSLSALGMGAYDPEDTEVPASSCHQPFHSYRFGLPVDHTCPRGMKSPAVCREPLLQGREHGGEDEDEAVWPYTKPSSPTLTFCFLTFKNKEWCKYNSLLLEAGHWTDIVGPEVVYDWSQSFYPLLKEKEKAFLVSKTTGTENSGFHETACIHSV